MSNKFIFINYKDDAFVKNSFEKYSLKLCTVNVIDCFTNDLLKNFKSTPIDSTVVKLDENLKKKLNLVKSDKLDNLRSSKFSTTTKSSRCKQRKSQAISIDSNTSEINRRDSVTSNNDITIQTKSKRNT